MPVPSENGLDSGVSNAGQYIARPVPNESQSSSSITPSSIPLLIGRLPVSLHAFASSTAWRSQGNSFKAKGVTGPIRASIIVGSSSRFRMMFLSCRSATSQGCMFTHITVTVRLSRVACGNNLAYSQGSSMPILHVIFHGERQWLFGDQIVAIIRQSYNLGRMRPCFIKNRQLF